MGILELIVVLITIAGLFIIAFNEYGIKDRLNFPTHWMPLPEAPNE